MTSFTHQRILAGNRLRQKFLCLFLVAFFLIGFVSLAEAITISVAEVQKGLAVVQGGKAAKSATISGHILKLIRNPRRPSAIIPPSFLALTDTLFVELEIPDEEGPRQCYTSPSLLDSSSHSF
jgi:hypothetical protein